MTSDMFNHLPITLDEIKAPKLWDDVECLKQVSLYESTHHYKTVANKFTYCRAKWFYCRLAIWRDNQWVLYFSRSGSWPWGQPPFVGQFESGYRASKNRGCHYFDLTDGQPWDEVKHAA